MKFIQTKYSERNKSKHFIIDSVLNKKMNDIVSEKMLETGIYNLLSLEDIQEFIFRISCFNSHKENRNYFLNNILFNGIYKDKEIIPITEEDILSYFGSYLMEKQFNMSRKDWLNRNENKLRIVKIKTKKDNIKTAELIATCICKNLSSMQLNEIKNLAKERIDRINNFAILHDKYLNLIKLISDTDLIKMLELLKMNTLNTYEQGVFLIEFRWLYLNGLILVDVDDNTIITTFSFIDFKTPLREMRRNKINLDSFQKEHNLSKLDEILKKI